MSKIMIWVRNPTEEQSFFFGENSYRPFATLEIKRIPKKDVERQTDILRPLVRKVLKSNFPDELRFVDKIHVDFPKEFIGSHFKFQVYGRFLKSKWRELGYIE